jgi:hypothetical protein
MDFPCRSRYKTRAIFFISGGRIDGNTHYRSDLFCRHPFVHCGDRLARKTRPLDRGGNISSDFFCLVIGRHNLVVPGVSAG